MYEKKCDLVAALDVRLIIALQVLQVLRQLSLRFLAGSSAPRLPRLRFSATVLVLTYLRGLCTF